MTLYKFLAPLRRHPLSGAEFPIGAWVEAGEPASDGPEGVRACAVTDLAHWIDGELWEVELAGEVTPLPCSLIAPRGRLVRRVDAWTGEIGRELAVVCAWHARDTVVERLAGAGHHDVAGALRAPTVLADLAVAASSAAADAPAGWADPIGLLAEVADEATNARAVVAMLTATVAVAGWDDVAQAAERRWQSAWIADRLSLGPV